MSRYHRRRPGPPGPNRPPRRSTAPGQHRPVMLDEVLAVLDPKPGEVALDCTIGWAGHAVELLRRVGPTGRLVGTDFDAENLEKARERLAAVGHPFALHHGNFAGTASALGAARFGDEPPDSLPLSQVDMVLADLGMSSMQVDDPGRGFSYVRDGPLDMRMDRSRGRTAFELLRDLPEDAIRQALEELGDEPNAAAIAAAVVAARSSSAGLPDRTTGLAHLISAAVPSQTGNEWRLHPSPNIWKTHPAARTFQALRILVNRELANLAHLLRVLPGCLRAGGRVAIISFHSGEDRLVKAAFRDGVQAGVYAAASPDPVRPAFDEKTANPRSRSAKLRWARRSARPPES